MIYAIAVILSALTLLGYLCSRDTARYEGDDEGTPWNWGDPDSPGYRLDMTRAQRIQAAAAWRAAHGESE